MKLYQHIEQLWSYMQLGHKLQVSDCIFVLGSNDLRVAEYAATLYLEGWAKTLIFSGGVGRLTDGVFDKSEAETFAEIAKDMGVPSNAIIVENKATNTGENVLYTASLLNQLGHRFSSFILVQKPYMERRTYATFIKQWPGVLERFCVTSPRIEFSDYFNDDIDLDTTVRAMLGDFDRIKRYPAMGYQIEQEIPDSIEMSFKALRAVFHDNE